MEAEETSTCRGALNSAIEESCGHGVYDSYQFLPWMVLKALVKKKLKRMHPPLEMSYLWQNVYCTYHAHIGLETYRYGYSENSFKIACC